MPSLSRRRYALVAALLLGLASALPAAAEAIRIDAREVALDPERPQMERIGELSYRGGLSLTSPHEKFGGLSGLARGENGALLAVSDHGFFISFRPVLEQGRLVDVGSGTLDAILDSKGIPVPRRRAGDAEAIARDRDGGLLVSFEQIHRVAHFPAPPRHIGAAASPTVLPPQADLVPNNGGFEAMTVLADGRWLMIAEEWRNEAGDFAGWLVERGEFKPIGFAPTAFFNPSDVTALPDGGALVLERRFTFLGGFGARLSYIPPAALVPGTRLQGREIARIETPLTRDNFEGVVALPDPAGGYLVYLVSDDNYNSLERTLLVLFHWPG